jgi:UDP-N-acetylglucosamine 2-epimerase (non-hydrolysing)
MKVLSVVGARPQFVKAAPVSARLCQHHEEVFVHTGQHYDHGLSTVFFEELDLPEPDHHLCVGSAGHAEQTARMLRELDAVVEEEAPDVVLVYGDTNSTLAGALSAAKRGVALAHVEAGLRSGDWSMPEEVNRVLTDHASDVLFAPGERAAGTLAEEGITDGVHVVGDVMYDAVAAVRPRIAAADPPVDVPGQRDDRSTPGEFVLATVHRAGNTDDPGRLASIVDGLARAPMPVVLPAHPRTVDALDRHGLAERAEDALRLTDPLGYVEFLSLLEASTVVATDSGGVQKEAFYLDTPCVTLREETEWVETVAAGWNRLVGADATAIEAALRDPPAPADKPGLYGDGTAAEGVVDTLQATVGRAVRGERS